MNNNQTLQPLSHGKLPGHSPIIKLYILDNAIIGYSSASCCTYAKEAFHGFEYPPGCPLDIEYYTDGAAEAGGAPPNAGQVPMGGQTGGFSGNQGGFGGNPGGFAGNSGGFNGNPGTGFGNSSAAQYTAAASGNNYGQTSPSPMPYAPHDADAKKRLFIVSHPEQIPSRILSDMFSRFGNLISVNYIPGWYES